MGTPFDKVSDFLDNPMERAGEYASKHAWKMEYGPQLPEQDIVRSIEAKQRITRRTAV